MNDSEYHVLLKEMDDPIHWESPPEFNYLQAVDRFKEFVKSVEAELDEPLRTETESMIQDASFHSQVILPTKGDAFASVRFSNFGNMASVCGEENVEQEVISKIEKLLNEQGYVFVPAKTLKQPYDGPNAGVTGIPDWWTRYFDWV